MQILVLDTETTGKDNKIDQILEVGMIVMDTLKDPTEWKSYHRVVRHDRYSGSAFAINLNSRLFNILADKNSDTIHINCLANDIYQFLLDAGYSASYNGPIYVFPSGKNVMGFDVPFLRNVPGMSDLVVFMHRGLDPAILYTDFFADSNVPDLATCKTRAGLSDIVTHNALEDAWDVALLLMHKKMGYDVSQLITDDWVKVQFGWTEGGKWTLKDGKRLIFTGTPNPFTRYGIESEDGAEFVWQKAKLIKLRPENKMDNDGAFRF